MEASNNSSPAHAHAAGSSSSSSSSSAIAPMHRPLPVEDAPKLIWDLDETREMFQKHRLWPSFVGAKQEVPYYSQNAKKMTGKLPVLLWPEQEEYLEEKRVKQEAEAAALAKKSSSKKRKRQRKRVRAEEEEEEEEEEDEEEVVVRGKKKQASASSTAEEDDEDEEEEDEDEEDEEEEDEEEGEERVAKRARGEEEPDGSGIRGGLWGTVVSWANSVARIVSPYLPTSLFGGRGDLMIKANSSQQSKLLPSEYQLSIFRACQQHGYFIGPGDVYGGDYNIYRGGDPSNSHSTATIRVVRRRSIVARDLLSFSRVQNQVAKSAVLAYIDPDSEDPAFLVVNFRNVSERI